MPPTTQSRSGSKRSGTCGIGSRNVKVLMEGSLYSGVTLIWRLWYGVGNGSLKGNRSEVQNTRVKL